jgi:hypothetical protein
MKNFNQLDKAGSLSNCQCIKYHQRKDKIIQTRDRLGKKFTICVCKNCGLIRQQTMMTPEETKIYYSSGKYREDDKTNEQFKSLDEFYMHQKKNAAPKIEFNKTLSVGETINYVPSKCSPG